MVEVEARQPRLLVGAAVQRAASRKASKHPSVRARAAGNSLHFRQEEEAGSLVRVEATNPEVKADHKLRRAACPAG